MVGVTLLYGLCRYLPRNRVWFSRFLVLKPQLLARVDAKLLQIMRKLQILLDKAKITFNNNNKQTISAFENPECRHLGFHDVTALSYCFKQNNLSFPTIETMQ